MKQSHSFYYPEPKLEVYSYHLLFFKEKAELVCEEHIELPKPITRKQVTAMMPEEATCCVPWLWCILNGHISMIPRPDMKRTWWEGFSWQIRRKMRGHSHGILSSGAMTRPEAN